MADETDIGCGRGSSPNGEPFVDIVIFWRDSVVSFSVTGSPGAASEIFPGVRMKQKSKRRNHDE